jgi:uncharacterized protein YjbI with pentapeptide repeats
MSYCASMATAKGGTAKTPHLMSIPTAVLIATGFATVAGALILLVLWWQTPATAVAGKPARDVLEVVKTTIAVAAFFGAVLTGVYAYRKQQLAEAESHRADAASARADAVEFTRRYGEALTHLGDAQAAVRLGGAYSMARLADDWEDQRQTCIDVLCAYLRMRNAKKGEERHAEQEVRATIQRLIRSHVVVGARRDWHSHDFDLTGATLHGLDLHYALFLGKVTLDRASCTGSTSFENAHFGEDASFEEVSFEGNASFYDAYFAADVNFSNSQFIAIANFEDTYFGGFSTFSGVQFDRTHFTCAEFVSGGTFRQVQFQGEVSFISIKCGGPGRASALEFQDSRFCGDAHFIRAQFHGPSAFDKALFEQHATFGSSVFGPNADFFRVRFEGPVSFDGAHFTDEARLGYVMFRGDASFVDARFEGGTTFIGSKFFAGCNFTKAAFNSVSPPHFKSVCMKQKPEVYGMHVRKDPSLASVSFLDWPAPNRAELMTRGDIS